MFRDHRRAGHDRMRRLQDALRRRLRRKATLPRRPRRRPSLRRRILVLLLARCGEHGGQSRRPSHRRPLARAHRRLRPVRRPARRRLSSRRAQPPRRPPRSLPLRALAVRSLPRRRPIDVPVHASILGIVHERRRRVRGHRLRFTPARRGARAHARPARRRQRPRRRALEIRLRPRVRDVRIGVEIAILGRREFPPASRARARRQSSD